MRNVTVAISPYWSDDEEDIARQRAAAATWKRSKPDDVRLVAVCANGVDYGFANTLKHEGEVDWSTHVVRINGSTGGLVRELPFIRDMLDMARLCLSDMIGLFNSDIEVTGKFFQALEDVDADSIHVHRTDVDPDGTNPVVDVASVDGWIIRRSIWDELHDDEMLYPGFLIGEPGWGYATTLWATHHNLKMEHMDMPGLCYHVRHDAEWKRRKMMPPKNNPSLWYNQALYHKLETNTGLEMDRETGRARRKEK